MSSIEAHVFALTPHDPARSSGVRAIEGRVMRGPDGMLTFTYSVEGDVSRMRVPPPRPVRRADGLWQHTCMEAFVAPNSGSAYLELNFSPSGEWAIYAFSAYRTDMAVIEDIETPAITVTRGEDWLTVEAAVHLKCLRGASAARLALAAVVEESSGNLSYWALEHPAGKPDFHHPRGFALKI